MITDWRRSKTHLTFLSLFLEPTPVWGVWQTGWAEKLHERPQQTIDRWLADDLLVVADIEAHLSYRFTAGELEDMLKQRGMSVPESKDEMITILLQIDPESMSKIAQQIPVFCCSEKGRKIAERHVNTEKRIRALAEQRVVDAFRRRRFKDAIRLVETYQQQQIFYGTHSYGIGKNEFVLRDIFDYAPKSVARAGSEYLERCQIAAGLNYLWIGQSLGGVDFGVEEAVGLTADGMPVIRMFVSHALLDHEKANYIAKGISRVKIINGYDWYYGGFDVCDTCQLIKDKTYDLGRMPDLPHEECTCKYGCQCWIEANEL